MMYTLANKMIKINTFIIKGNNRRPTLRVYRPIM